MRKKGISLLFMIICSLSTIQSSIAFSNPIYISLNESNRVKTLILPLNASKYNISMNVIECKLGLDTDVLMFITINLEEIFRTSIDYGYKAFEFTFMEAGDYNITFFLQKPSSNSYWNLEFSVIEIEELPTTIYTTLIIDYVTIVQTKSSIISEVPYGLGVIILAVICISLVTIWKRRKIEI